MGSPQQSLREPCPDRLLADFGVAFGVGAIVSSVDHLFGGGLQSVRINATNIGAVAGKYGVWGGLFSVVDCGMLFVRQKDDAWNTIVVAGATAGLLHIRRGFRVASSYAFLGAGLLGAVELGIAFFNRVVSMSSSSTREFVYEHPGVGVMPSGGPDINKLKFSHPGYSLSLMQLVARDQQQPQQLQFRLGGIFALGYPYVSYLVPPQQPSSVVGLGEKVKLGEEGTIRKSYNQL